MRVSSYIKESEKREFCNKCNEICGEHCVIFRKASIRYDIAQEKKDTEDDEYVPSATRGDYSPSNPWDAPGMSVSDFL